jgi:branched-chain amino acid aminotransferase
MPTSTRLCWQPGRSAGVAVRERLASGKGNSIMALIPFHDRDGSIWMDGALMPWRDAKLHVLSHALHYGSAVFEGERAYGGEVFKLTEHTERLKAGANTLDFEIPYSVAEINQACRDVVSANKAADCYLRPIAWRGSEQMGVTAQRYEDGQWVQSKVHFAIASWEWGSYFDAATKMKGIRLSMAHYRRPDPATAPAKTKAVGLYMICTIEKQRAERAGYADAVMLDYRGRVAECTGANMFFIKDGVIHSPTPDCFLDGITRQTVIGLAKKRGIEVIERVIMPEELPSFSECFIVGTAAEVTPVSEIAGTVYKPGKISETLLHDYMTAVQPVKLAKTG